MKFSHSLDFTSSLYLGLEHPSSSLMQWERLTLGKPAALEPPGGIREVERDLAALTGCRQALLAPSTLHLFWDLFGILARRGIGIFLDAGSYPIARWGVERAAGLGIPVRVFRQYDPQALASLLAEKAARRPVVVADGYCPFCGAVAPVAEYLRCVKPLGGVVVLDDTQALGIFGPSQGVGSPYGLGGGGSLQRAGVRDDRVILISSLAKAFGAPVAMLAGSEEVVADFERESATRTHCSPPSAAVIAAAGHALMVNRLNGDMLRRRLARRVAEFRSGLQGLNLVATKGLFPMQSIRMPEGTDPATVHEALLAHGVRTVLHRGNGSSSRISFIMTARHDTNDIERAVASLLDALRHRPAGPWKGTKTYVTSVTDTGGTLRSVFGNHR